MSDNSKTHGEHESSTLRLHTPIGFCYLKVHQTRSHWCNEVHAYEHWTCAFGGFAPRLLAVRDEMPLAILISELPGQIAGDAHLPPSQERAIWQTAGAALVALHNLRAGECFGPCLRDGTCVDPHPQDARDYISKKLKSQMDYAIRVGYINAGEQSVIQAAYDRISAFGGEPPIPCHRDYCAANWLISKEGNWTGVIDFEFAYGDVRVADFSRDPDWSWIHRPDLVDAFFKGYGRLLTPVEEQQLLVARAEYALSAIVWGHQNAFYGFEQEGHEALTHLARLLN